MLAHIILFFHTQIANQETEKTLSHSGKKNRCNIEIVSRDIARMLTKEVAEKLSRFHLQQSLQEGGCLLRYDDHGPRGEAPPIIPYAPFEHSRVYTGTRESGSYNHHSQIARFKDRYYFAWSNGLVDEENAGQRILISSSDDAVRWSEPVCVAGDRNDTVTAHNCIALHSTQERLYVVGMKEDTSKDALVPGMRRINPDSEKVIVHASNDGRQWGKVFTFADELTWIFEAPRLSADGHLLCAAGTKNEGAAILRWPGNELCEHPEIIEVPQPHGSVFYYGEGTWYQTDDGTIVVFQRDEGRSCRVWVSYSEDGGKTFSEAVISDIPNSMSRLYAGRLNDGRYYLCDNAFGTLLNRMYLMLMLSDNGYEFNKVYILIDDPTSQRLMGLLKADGYQYPCCLAEENRLLVGYSINKEDIECGIVDVSTM